MDVESVDKMRDMLKDTMEEAATNEEIEAYKQWLTTHSEKLKHSIANNQFYNFEGAPIWKYGIHFIIFDKKHLATPFYSGEVRSAIFIHDCPEIATALADSMDWLKDVLQPKGLSSDDLATLAGPPEGPARG